MSARGLAPSAAITQTALPVGSPAGVRSNAIDRPSGDHLGWLSWNAGSLVSGYAACPGSSLQIRPPFEYTTDRPSGENIDRSILFLPAVRAMTPPVSRPDSASIGIVSRLKVCSNAVNAISPPLREIVACVSTPRPTVMGSAGPPSRPLAPSNGILQSERFFPASALE